MIHDKILTLYYKRDQGNLKLLHFLIYTFQFILYLFIAMMKPGAKYLAAPLAYLMLVKSLDKYYLNNELRYLYKQDLLVPWLRRIDDQQCSDARDLRHELETSSKVDLSKSMVHKQMLMVQSKGQTAKDGRKVQGGAAKDVPTSTSDRESQSNMNLIARD